MPNHPYPVPPRNRTGTRTGYTTGSCAAAAAKAATLALIDGAALDKVTISLPIGETATFQPVEWRLTPDRAYCCVVKDAGDDPDVTHGALICAAVQRSEDAGVRLRGGIGVGVVTLPGLGLPVGEPAINPVPREQITANVLDALATVAHPTGGLTVTIEVPEGEELARRTLNPRLGISGGISILGTTGIVYPYSTAAWRASVIQAVEMAAANSVDKVVLATGGRSERFAMSIFPELPNVAFVEVSVFTGDGLKTCLRCGVASVVFVAMIGKLVKTAQGHFVTHVAGNQVDMNFLATITAELGAAPDLIEAIRGANTARHFLELCQTHGLEQALARLTQIALEQCYEYVQGRMDVEVVLVDFAGRVLSRAARLRQATPHAEEQLPFMHRIAHSDAELGDTPEAIEDRVEPE